MLYKSGTYEISGKCNDTVMKYNLENKRIRTVEDIINK